MAGLVDGEIVGAGSEEGCWWVEGAVVEDCVDGDGEKGRQGLLEGEGCRELEGFDVGRGGGGHLWDVFW